MSVALLVCAGCGPSVCVDDSCSGQVRNFDEPRPAQVDTSQRFAAMGLGNSHACMLTADGMAWCWGSNWFGQLGAPATQRCMDGTVPCSAKPLPVAGGLSFSSLVAGMRFTCALTVAGAPWCWGNGDYMQDNNDKVPVAVPGGHAFVQIAASRFDPLVCGLKSDGSLWCWGDGFAAGGSGPAPSAEPSRWTALADVAFSRIALGESFACGLDAAGQAWCVGSNGGGQLGNGGDAESSVPVPVAGARAYTEIVAGNYQGCALDTGGQAWCWGSGYGVGDGQVGGDVRTRTTPVAVAGGHRFVHLSAGPSHTCGLANDGYAWCWGPNHGGTLGDGTFEGRPAPAAVLAPPMVAVAAGGEITCSIDVSGAAWCWGHNESGAVGRPIVQH